MGRIARKAHLLQTIDDIRFHLLAKKFRRQNEAFTSSHPDVPIPPADIAYDAYGHVNMERYFKTGLANARSLAERLMKHLPQQPLQVCEWGCGPARIIQHLHQFLPEGSQLSGSDYNEKTIAWCRDTFTDIRFELNQLAPPLLFETEQFDAIYAQSVFTHLSESMCRAWMAELERVVKPGGIIILTTKSDGQRARLLPAERQSLDQGVPIFRSGITEGKRMYDTILPAAWVKSELIADLELLEHDPGDISQPTQQDVFVVRKPR